MKKIIFILSLIFSLYTSYGQTAGISYQAVILNPNEKEIPGKNITKTNLANSNIQIRFTIIDDSGYVEYKESHNTTTDRYG